jgi:hypothetical protein
MKLHVCAALLVIAAASVRFDGLVLLPQRLLPTCHNLCCCCCCSYSMCNWGRTNSWEWAVGVGNSWRTYQVGHRSGYGAYACCVNFCNPFCEAQHVSLDTRGLGSGVPPMQSHSYFSLSDQWSSAVKCGLLTATNYLPLCVQDVFLNWPILLRALDNGAAGVALTLVHSKAPPPTHTQHVLADCTV